MKRKFLVLGVLVAAVLLSILGYFYFFKKKPTVAQVPIALTKQKVYIIGLDGASWNLMKGPLEEGKLPNIKKLMDSGSYTPLHTFVPTKSPILWTSIATGKNKKKHGIGDYVAEKDGKMIPVSGNERITKAFWNICSDYGLRVGVMNWWVTWPPEKVNGWMVSDRYRNGIPKKLEAAAQTQPNHPDLALTYPPELIRSLPAVGITDEHYMEERALYGLPKDLKPPGADSKNIDLMVRGYKSYWGQDKAVWEATNRLLAKHDIDVFGSVFRIIDVSSHLFWTYIDPKLIEEMRKKTGMVNLPADRLDAEETDADKPRGKKQQGQDLDPKDAAIIDAAFAKVVGPIYMYADKIVGDIVKEAGPDANIIVCSDHGFKFYDGRYGHSGMPNPPDGILVLSGPIFKTGAKLDGATLLDITPTLLYAEGIPVGRDMDGKILFGAFKPEFIKKHTPTMVASHDHGVRQPGEPLSSGQDEQILEDLRSLGYIQ